MKERQNCTNKLLTDFFSLVCSTFLLKVQYNDKELLHIAITASLFKKNCDCVISKTDEVDSSYEENNCYQAQCDQCAMLIAVYIYRTHIVCEVLSEQLSKGVKRSRPLV